MIDLLGLVDACLDAQLIFLDILRHISQSRPRNSELRAGLTLAQTTLPDSIINEVDQRHFLLERKLLATTVGAVNHHRYNMYCTSTVLDFREIESGRKWLF